MRTFQNLTFIISAILLLTVPSTGFCMNIKKETIPLLEMLQNGTAKVTTDKKNIIDDKGNFIAKETSNTAPKQTETECKSSRYSKRQSGSRPADVYLQQKMRNCCKTLLHGRK